MALHKPPSTPSVPGEGKSPFPGEMAQRLAGSVIVVACVVGGIILGGRIWQIVASLIAMGSLWELYQMMSSKYKISRAWGLVGGLAILVTISLGFSYAVTLSIISIVAFLILFTEIIRRQTTGKSFALWNLGGTLSGIIYIVLPWSFLIVIRTQTWGHIFLLTIFACTWSCDVGAYLIGSKFGSIPFCRRVSPKKSWEGFWAGVAFSTICGSALAIFFEFPPIPLLLLGLLCGVAGQLGDLAESVLKREANVKDSGRAIPGHGGFLDRFDSILINASLAFFIFEIIG